MAHVSRARLRSEFTNENQHILGKPRWMWVEDACRAVIQGTTAEGRWKIVREGFPKFQTLGLAAFKQLSHLPLTSSEVRYIFEGLTKYAEVHDKRLHRAFERMYDDHRHRWDKMFAQQRDILLTDEDPRGPIDDVKVEAVRDGTLRRVS
jgi:hypothetical protein